MDYDWCQVQNFLITFAIYKPSNVNVWKVYEPSHTKRLSDLKTNIERVTCHKLSTIKPNEWIINEKPLYSCTMEIQLHEFNDTMFYMLLAALWHRCYTLML